MTAESNEWTYAYSEMGFISLTLTQLQLQHRSALVIVTEEAQQLTLYRVAQKTGPFYLIANILKTP